MATFSQVFHIDNIKRAYRWVLSNPDARYKNYFRADYSAYALATDLNLKILRRQIQSGRFMPSHASKVYLPKSSGLLRPISLLTINDQVAYQACVNVIAEALQKKTEKRHRKTVFYPIYAGKQSAFFCIRWETSYKSFANAVRTAFARGLTYIATFDLTAFYDSIDHHVLREFLRRSGIDQDTINFLLVNLRQWTESTWGAGKSQLIYHEHGIPQGPSCSGMLAEVVLQHLDKIGDTKSRDVQYLRYVDDIKLIARDEKTLRRKLVALDIAAKEIGLFPQASKIAIRKIADPEEEIKSVSVPLEVAMSYAANQPDIRARIKVLANRGNPKDVTRFKYVLPRLEPTNKSNGVLFKVLINHPELAGTIARHFEKYRRLPNSLADKIISILIEEGVYHSVNADLMKLLYGRIGGVTLAKVSDFAYARLFAGKYRNSGFAAPQPTYRAALIQWALLSPLMTYVDAEGLIRRERDWWVLQEVLSRLDQNKFGKPSFQSLLNLGMRAAGSDASRVAASLIFANSLAVVPPTEDCHWAARLLLRNVGLLPYAGRAPSLISAILSYTVRFSGPYNWTKLFGSYHSEAERLAILAKQRFETDIDAYVVSLDSFCDQVMRQVYHHNGQVMNAPYGNVLGAGAPNWLRNNFPTVRHGFDRLHKLRIRSFTAHPRHQGGAPNKRITHSQYYRVRRDLLAAFGELTQALPF